MLRSRAGCRDRGVHRPPRRGRVTPAASIGDATMAADPGHGDLTTSFGDRLADRVASRRSQIVLGLDPDPARLWPEAVRRAESAGLAGAPGGSEAGADVEQTATAARAARAVAVHCALAIEATA